MIPSNRKNVPKPWYWIHPASKEILEKKLSPEAVTFGSAIVKGLGSRDLLEHGLSTQIVFREGIPHLALDLVALAGFHDLPALVEVLRPLSKEPRLTAPPPWKPFSLLLDAPGNPGPLLERSIAESPRAAKGSRDCQVWGCLLWKAGREDVARQWFRRWESCFDRSTCISERIRNIFFLHRVLDLADDARTLLESAKPMPGCPEDFIALAHAWMSLFGEEDRARGLVEEGFAIRNEDSEPARAVEARLLLFGPSAEAERLLESAEAFPGAYYHLLERTRIRAVWFDDPGKVGRCLEEAGKRAGDFGSRLGVAEAWWNMLKVGEPLDDLLKETDISGLSPWDLLAFAAAQVNILDLPHRGREALHIAQERDTQPRFQQIVARYWLDLFGEVEEARLVLEKMSQGEIRKAGDHFFLSDSWGEVLDDRDHALGQLQAARESYGTTEEIVGLLEKWVSLGIEDGEFSEMLEAAERQAFHRRDFMLVARFHAIHLGDPARGRQFAAGTKDHHMRVAVLLDLAESIRNRSPDPGEAWKCVTTAMESVAGTSDAVEVAVHLARVWNDPSQSREWLTRAGALVDDWLDLNNCAKGWKEALGDEDGARKVLEEALAKASSPKARFEVLRSWAEVFPKDISVASQVEESLPQAVTPSDYLAAWKAAESLGKSRDERDQILLKAESAVTTVNHVFELVAASFHWVYFPSGMVGRLLEKGRKLVRNVFQLNTLIEQVMKHHRNAALAREWLLAGESRFRNSYDLTVLARTWKSVLNDPGEASACLERAISLASHSRDFIRCAETLFEMTGDRDRSLALLSTAETRPALESATVLAEIRKLRARILRDPG